MSNIEKINLAKVWAKVEDLADTAMTAAVADAAARLYKEIVDRTPVDKADTQKNWEIDYGFGFQKVRGSFSGKQQSIVDKKKYKTGTTITIRNRTPYAFMLEYGGYGPGPKTVGGFSKQAPKGMMRISALQFKQFLDKAVRDNKI